MLNNLVLSQSDIPTIILKDKEKEIILRKALLWDVPVESLDLKKNRKLIIERVFSRGNIDEFKQVKNYYSEDEIREILGKVKNPDKKTAKFISKLYHIKIEQ